MMMKTEDVGLSYVDVSANQGDCLQALVSRKFARHSIPALVEVSATHAACEVAAQVYLEIPNSKLSGQHFHSLHLGSLPSVQFRHPHPHHSSPENRTRQRKLARLLVVGEAFAASHVAACFPAAVKLRTYFEKIGSDWQPVRDLAVSVKLCEGFEYVASLLPSKPIVLHFGH